VGLLHLRFRLLRQTRIGLMNLLHRTHLILRAPPLPQKEGGFEHRPEKRHYPQILKHPPPQIRTSHALLLARLPVQLLHPVWLVGLLLHLQRSRKRTERPASQNCLPIDVYSWNHLRNLLLKNRL
jgi:hypothetical protein